MEIINIINEAKKMNIPKYRSCKILQINYKRIERWEARLRLTGSLNYCKSGPKVVLHAITPKEKKAVLDYAGQA